MLPTLAASLLTEHYPVLTDDCLLIRAETDHILGVSSYSGVRLWPDSIDAVVGGKYELQEMSHYSSKKRLLLADVDSTDKNAEIPIAALFLLASPPHAAKTETVDLETVDGARIVAELLRHSFSLDVSDKKATAIKFANVGAIAASGLPVYQLTYPRSHAALDAVRTAVKQIVMG